MARFANLHDAGRALASHIQRNITPRLSDVSAGPPIENANSAEQALRITLMWVTPQPTHRNDSWFTGADGQSHPPPLSLSAFYVVTAYGTAPTGEPIQAINRLGQAIQVLETEPMINLPLIDDPSTADVNEGVPGNGQMTAVLVPVAADLMEKIFTPLQMRHRPWALVELGPIQLDRLLAAVPGPNIVAPGGIKLMEPRPISRPVISAVSPVRLGAGRRLRLDTAEASGVEGLRLGAETYNFADPPVAPNEIAKPDDEGRVFVTYPAAGATGDIDAVLVGSAAGSAPFPLAILSSTVPALDAPEKPLEPGKDLVLHGANLTLVNRVFLWPDRGIQAPDEVIKCQPDQVSAGEIKLERDNLNNAGLRPIHYRVAARLGLNHYTQFVIVEVKR